MIRKKYSSDYKVHQTLNKDGRLKKEAEYVGSKYVFALSGETRLPLARKFFFAGILGWAAYLLPLATRNHLSNVVFCILPHVCTAIPLWFLFHGIFQAAFSPEPLIREKADKAFSHLCYGTAAALVFSALAALGDLIWGIFLSQGNLAGGDYLFFLCDCYLLVFSILAFRHQDLCRTEPV